LLWTVFYGAILYLIFSPPLYRIAMPILIFSLSYLYLMGKGYLGPYFARVTMLLFPGFCILTGIVYADLQSRLKSNRALAVVLTGALLLIVSSSVVFGVAYDRAMQQRDVRQVVQEDLQKSIGEAPATIGI